ncbi:MAG: efflux RND transporter periplasmic adaptor subunit [Acidobacteriota bacterium]|nr:MAG: efflux RND transporter periplasmic adaptor subunit [Acidobacteriota bacterium]
MKFRLISLFIPFLALILLINGCGGGETPASASRERGESNLPAKEVSLARAELRRLVRTVTAPGTLAADEQATLSFKVAGRLSSLSVDLGTPVRKGQIVAQIETNDFKVRLEQAEAALQQARVRLGLPPQGTDDRIDTENMALVRQARALLDEAVQNRERARQLVQQGIQPQAELDRVESAYKVADSRYQDAVEEVRNRQAVLLQRRSELAIARQQLAETTLYAPFDGAVLERLVTIGEFLAPGTPAMRIVRLHPLRLRLEVPEREARGINIGEPVRVTVDDQSGRNYSGRVARLSPAFNELSRTLIIEAEVDNERGLLRPGSFARADIETSSTSEVVMVPASAIVNFAGIQKVFTVKDGKAVEHNVTVGRTIDDWSVVQGIPAETTVVVRPGNLATGQRVDSKK